MSEQWQSRRTGRRGFTPAEARRILRRDRVCQLQLAGCSGEAVEADHRVSWADAMAAGWEPEDVNDPDANGQGVCRSCHQQKTQAEAQRGRARARAQRPKNRPKVRHPGLLP